MRFLSLLLLMACAAVDTVAAEIVVPDAHPTIQAAINAAKPGDVVRVKAGRYTESLTFKNGITLQGEGADKTVVCDPSPTAGVLLVKDCPEGVVRGMSFEADTKRAAPLVSVQNSGVTVEDCAARISGGIGFYLQEGTAKLVRCTATKTIQGIFVTNRGADATVTESTGTDCKYDGIVVSNGAKATVTKCTAKSNGRHGVSVTGEGTQATVVDSTCADNKGAGINVDKGASAKLEANTCERNTRSGIRAEDDAMRVEAVRNVLRDNLRYGLRYGKNPNVVDRGNDYTRNGEITRQEIQNLWNQERFADLEKIATRLRKDKTRFLHGAWQLDDFYLAFLSGAKKMNAQQEADVLNRLKRWQKEFPQSITPRIIHGNILYQFAWRERGSGFSNTVTEEGWQGYHRYMDQAARILLEAEKSPEGKTDPELYTLLADMALAEDRQDVAAIRPWDKGVALEPTFTPLYYAKARSLIPRYGGRPGQMEAFADRAVQLTKQQEGETKYMEIALKVIDWDGFKGFFENYDFDWPRIRQGYEDYSKRYPHTSVSGNYVARLACLYGDREAAADLIKRIGTDYFEPAWGSADRFNKWRQWAEGKGSPPEPIRDKLKTAPTQRT